MRTLIAVIGLVVPSLSLAQSACPNVVRDHFQCYATKICDDAARLAFLRALRSQDAWLSAVVPAPTADEKAAYNARLQAAEGARELQEVVQSDIQGRMALYSSISQRYVPQMNLMLMLDRRIAAAQGGSPGGSAEVSREDMTAAWVELARAYAQTEWIEPWVRIRSTYVESEDASLQRDLADEIANCSSAVVAMLTILAVDLDAR